MQISWKHPLSALPVLLLLAAHAGTAWGAVAGNVQFVIGDVKLTDRAGQTKALQKGAEVNEGDRVVTGDGASAQIKMIDGGFIAIRPNTDMGFDTYNYNGKEDGTENAVVSLIQGGFRTITGLIGRTNKQNYMIKTVTSTIGIRGTDHEPMVILPPPPGRAAIAPSGTYDKVNVGIAYIRNEGGTVDIHRNQVGFAPDTKAPPRILPSIPPFFKPTPPPGPQKAKDEGKKEGEQTAATSGGKSGEIRNTAVVDPASSVATAPANAVIVSAPPAPVVVITASNGGGASVNLTAQTAKDCPTCTTTPAATPLSGPTAFVPTPAVPITGGTGNFRQVVYLPQTTSTIGASSGSSTYTGVYNLATGVVKGATNYLFDASGNLASILSSDYRLSDRGLTTPPSYPDGSLPYTSAPGGLPSSPLTGALVAFSGGTTPDGNYNDTVNGIRLGRYAGATITTTDSSNPANVLSFSTPLGSNSLLWALREIPASIPITGSFEYKPAYSTLPTDSLGNVGTLNYASLAANFTTQRVSPAVGITINNQNLFAAATNVPLDSTFGFDVSTNAALNASGSGGLRVSCFGSNCAPPPAGNPAFAPVGTSSSFGYVGYGGRITGGLAGAGGTAGGAFFRYIFDTYYNPLVAAGGTGGIPSGQTRPVNDYINGLVGFTQGIGLTPLAPATATSGAQAFSTAYFAPPPTAGGNYQDWNNGYRVSSAGYTNPFGTGSPNMVDASTASSQIPSSETLTGGTVAQAPTNSNSFAATGISFGRYSGGTVTGVDSLGTSFTRTVVGNYAWIKGPDVAYPAAALTASATYKFDGGTHDIATGGTGTGTVNSAVLAVNFSAAAVGVELSTSGGGHTWNATTSPTGVLTGTPPTTLGLNQGRVFFGSSFQVANPQLHQSLYVTHDASAVNAPGLSGQINGQLMGYNLSGAGMTYSFLDTTAGAPGTGVNGSVAFALDSYTSGPVTTNSTGSAIATTTTTLGTSAIDMNSVPYQIRIGGSGLSGNTSAASIDDQYLTFVRRAAEAVGRTSFDPVSGLPTAWDSISVMNSTTCTTCTPTQVPARMSIDPSSFVATGATPGANQVALPAGKSPATLLESGFDAATGMRWGRYGAGVIAVFDRVATGTNSTTGFTAATADATTQNWHTIQGPTQTGPTVLPITGTYTYTNVGGTHPTDNLGSAAGTLNAATLVADFAAQKVNAGVNVSVNGQTWSAGANAMPIQQGQNFGASRNQAGVGPLNVNVCSGAGCSTTTTIPTTSTASTSGSILGAFNGTTGQGAGMVYSLNKGGVTGTTVTGVVAFRR